MLLTHLTNNQKICLDRKHRWLCGKVELPIGMLRERMLKSVTNVKKLVKNSMCSDTKQELALICRFFLQTQQRRLKSKLTMMTM